MRRSHKRKNERPALIGVDRPHDHEPGENPGTLSDNSRALELRECGASPSSSRYKTNPTRIQGCAQIQIKANSHTPVCRNSKNAKGLCKGLRPVSLAPHDREEVSGSL